MTIFNSNGCDNTAIRNVDSVAAIDRYIARCYQIDIFNDFVYVRAQDVFNDYNCVDTVLTEDVRLYNTIVTNKGDITRYYQIDRSLEVLYSITTYKLTPNTEAHIRDSIGGNVNDSNSKYYQILPVSIK